MVFRPRSYEDSVCLTSDFGFNLPHDICHRAIIVEIQEDVDMIGDRVDGERGRVHILEYARHVGMKVWAY